MLTQCKSEVICCRHGIACEDGTTLSNYQNKKPESSACYSTTITDTSYESCNADLSLIDPPTMPKKVATQEHSLRHVLNRINNLSVLSSTSDSIKLTPANLPNHRHKHKPQSHHRSKTFNPVEILSNGLETDTFIVNRNKSGIYSPSNTSTEYENVSSSVSSVKSKKLPPVATNTKKQKNFQRRLALQNRFIGCLTAEQAENRTIGLSAFFAYYALPKSNFELTEEIENSQDRHFLPSLQLKIVYLSASGHYFHFPIKAIKFEDGTTMYQVQYGDKSALKFRTVERLIDYYSNYSAIRVGKSSRISAIDVFPVWKFTPKTDYKKDKKSKPRC